MSTYLALFRGINIGGHNRISMEDLVSLLETMGCNNIRTYIQSGNVIFDTTSRNRMKLSSDISKAVLQQYGFSPSVILLTVSELQDAIERNPFPEDDGKSLHFVFMAGPVSNPDLIQLSEYKIKSEKFVLGEKVLYLYAPDGIGKSRLVKKIEQYLGVTTTARNWNTVSRLARLFDSE